MSIEDLTGLEHAVNLEVFNLSKNQISNISPLSGLASLEWLNLYGNQISDLSPLSDLTNLEWLHLHGNQIPDLSPLSGLTNLEYLDIRFNYIDITPGSPAMIINNNLIAKGATVCYEPQNELESFSVLLSITSRVVSY